MPSDELHVVYVVCQVEQLLEFSHIFVLWDFLQGGPVGTSGAEIKSWERPWTVEEMRKNSSNWSLAGDAGVCRKMVKFNITNILIISHMLNIIYVYDIYLCFISRR